MPPTPTRLRVSREQVLAFRRTVGALDDRLPPGAASLRRAAWAGLQDSSPRAALHSIHARVAGVGPSTWEDPSLVQVWGPRFSAFVVPAVDRAVFTLGRLPDDAAGLRRATETASRLADFLDGKRMTYSEAGHAMGMSPNELRYAAPTGTVLIRWDGARPPVVWTVPAPDVEPGEARRELVRRYLHAYGPSTVDAFVEWAGVRPARGRASFDQVLHELTPVRTPIGDGWILAADEAALVAPIAPAAAARLLPSGDPYYLLWGEARSLLVADAAQRASLWTTRVWPGAVLVDGEVVGTWRRATTTVTVQPWRRLTREERGAVEAEATSLPLPGLEGPVVVRWDG